MPELAELGNRMGRDLGPKRAKQLTADGAALDLGDAAPCTPRQQIDVARQVPGTTTRRAPSRARGGGAPATSPTGTPRMIAAELFISTRTAEHHIAHIYTKIGVANQRRRPAGRCSTGSSRAPSAPDPASSRPAARCSPVPIRKWVGLPMPRRRPLWTMRSAPDPGRGTRSEGSTTMILATTTVEDVDRFLDVFATTGAEKRALHGSKGSTTCSTRPRRTTCGRCSTGTRPAGQAWCRPERAAHPQGGRSPRQARVRAAPRLVRHVRRETDDDEARPERSARVGLITDQSGALSLHGDRRVRPYGDRRHRRHGRPSAGRRSISSRTARPTTRSPRPGPRSSSSGWASTWWWAASTAQPPAIKRPVVDEAKKRLPVPEQYEGQECHPLIFCTGPVPAQQVEPVLPVADACKTGAKTFYLPSADYI